MFRIDREILNKASKEKDSKSAPLKRSKSVFDIVKLSFSNIIETVLDFKLYHASHWGLYIDNWINSLKHKNTTEYHRGDIIYVDLGAQNFGYEPSYPHTCIVLANRRNSVLIVPCSTKKYGSKIKEIIDVTVDDGFRHNSGVQSECFRWVDKTRVLYNTEHKTSDKVLKKLDNVLLSLAPTVKDEIRELKLEIEELKIELSELKEKDIGVRDT